VVSSGDTDGDVHPGQLSAERDALSVVARGCGDDAASPLVGVERGHERQAVADLERVGRLVILVLHEQLDTVTDERREARIRTKRRGRQITRDAVTRGFDVVEGDRPEALFGVRCRGHWGVGSDVETNMEVSAMITTPMVSSPSALRAKRRRVSSVHSGVT